MFTDTWCLLTKFQPALPLSLCNLINLTTEYMAALADIVFYVLFNNIFVFFTDYCLKYVQFNDYYARDCQKYRYVSAKTAVVDMKKVVKAITKKKMDFTSYTYFHIFEFYILNEFMLALCLT